MVESRTITDADSSAHAGTVVSRLRVEDVMVRGVITIHPSASVKEAVALMSRHRIRHLFITDNNDRAVGLLSQRDVFRYLARRFNEESEGKLQAVRDVMTYELMTIGPREPVSEAARRLVRERAGCLPVVLGDGRLLGIVTRSDLLRVLVDETDFLEMLTVADRNSQAKP